MAGTTHSNHTNPVAARIVRGAEAPVPEDPAARRLHRREGQAARSLLRQDRPRALHRSTGPTRSASPATRSWIRWAWRWRTSTPWACYRVQENGVHHRRQRRRCPAPPARSTAPPSWPGSWPAPRAVQTCFSSHWLQLAFGKTLGPADECLQAALDVAFHQSGYNVRKLLLALTQTDAFLYYGGDRGGHAMSGFRLTAGPPSAARGASPSPCRGWRSWASGRRAQAAPPAGPARRFVGVFQPGGTVRARYTPTGSEATFTLGPILKPLEPLQDRLLVIDGLDMKAAIGEQHQAGIVALLTGTPQTNGGSRLRRGPLHRSGDRHPDLDRQEAAGEHPDGRALGDRPVQGAPAPDQRPQLRGQRHLQPHPTAARSPADLRRPVRRGRSARWPPPAWTRKKSILDFVDRRYAALSARLGAADRRKLDQHLTKVREIEQALTVGARPHLGPHPGLPDPQPGRHLGLQPAHGPQRRRRRQGGRRHHRRRHPQGRQVHDGHAGDWRWPAI